MPDPEEAFVEDAKLGYLLRDEDEGRVFSSLGFSREAPETLRWALVEHARTAQVVEEERNQYGVKYAAKGRLRSPDHRDPIMLSVWIVERRNYRPRLVTAYPADGEEEA